MAISYIGGNRATANSASLPTFSAGDLAIVYAFRDGNTTAPTLPSGWTDLGTGGAGANSASGRAGYRVLQSGDTTTGTWTNATCVLVVVYRGQDGTTPVGATSSTTGNSSTVSYTALTLQVTDGTSWVVGLAGHRSTDTNLQNPPTGMTNRVTEPNATCETAAHDTNGGVSSWSLATVSVGGTSAGWRNIQVEIRAAASGGTNHEKNVDDSVTMSDARAFEQGKAIADTAGLADAMTFERGIVITDNPGIADDLTFEKGRSVAVDDSATVSDSFFFERLLTLADNPGITDSLCKNILFVYRNGIEKDYNPACGIDLIDIIYFEPLAQDWEAGKTFGAPQGFLAANTFPGVWAELGIPADTGLIWKVDRGTWVSGTTNYVRYDKTTDAVDGLDYTVLVSTVTQTTTRPGLSNQWIRSNKTGFSPRTLDSGYYGSVRVTGDATRWFSVEERKHGTSSSTEPSGTFPQMDGSIYWDKIPNYKGAWAASTSYTTGDYILEDGSFWRCQSSGTSGSTEPTWSGVSYGSPVDDNGGAFQWQRRYVHAGAWTQDTNYGFRVVATGGTVTTGPGNDVRKQAVTYSGDSTAFLLVSGVKPSYGVTGGTEPAWTSAAAGSLWEDGSIIWKFGSFDFSDGQRERLVLTGLAPASTNGKTITIVNPAGAGTKRDVVLADGNVLGKHGSSQLDGTDQESTTIFNFGGENIRLAEGESVEIMYDQANDEWILPFSGLTRDIDDTLSLSDSFTFERGLAIQDSVNVTETLAFDISMTLADTVGLTDALAFMYDAHLDDSIGLSDALLFEKGRTLADSVTLADAFTFERGLALAESVGLADALRFDRGLAIAEALILTDAIAKDLGLTIGETLALADNVTPEWTPAGGTPFTVNIDDSVALTDALSFIREILIADNVTIQDSLARQLNGLFLSDEALGRLIRRLIFGRRGFY